MDTITYTSSSPLIHNLPTTNSTTLKTTNFHKIAGLLSASLYRFPIPSAVREILQNALDANKASKTTNKVKIILPSNNFPFISIQDFGLGISPEFFSQLYSDLGYSTKSEDNNYTGGFGIGKLAPLSFSSQLFINSVCNNEEHTYIVTKEDNQFSFKHLSSSPTLSPSGTTVKFPCEPSKHREAYHAIFYFCEFIPSLVEIYKWHLDGSLRETLDLTKHLQHFQSSEVVLTKDDSPSSSVLEPIRFDYFLPRNAGGTNFSQNAQFTPVPILVSFLIGDIAYSLSASLKNQLLKYFKEDLKDKTTEFNIKAGNLKICPFFSDSLNNSKHLHEFNNLQVTLVNNYFRDIYTADSHSFLKVEDNLLYHNIVVHLLPNAVTLTSSREFIQDTPHNNSFLIKVIYAVLSKIVYIENSLPRQYEHLIQQGDLGQFLYEMIDPAFLEEKFSFSSYSNSISNKKNKRDDNTPEGFLYRNTVYPSIDPRIKNSTTKSSHCPTETTYSLFQLPYDSKLFRTKQFINSYITENFCYSAKSDVTLSLLNCNIENSFVTDFSFKSFYQEGKCSALNTSHCTQHNSFHTFDQRKSSHCTGVFIQCSSPSFTSFCKHLELVEVLSKCSNLSDRYYYTKRKQQNQVNHLEFTYFLSFFSHTRKGYIVYYNYKTDSNLKIKNLISLLQKQYPDCVDWDILFVPYRCKYEIVTLLDNSVTEKLPGESPNSERGNEEVYCKNDLTRFLSYFRSSLIILNNDLGEETVKVVSKPRFNKVEKSTLEIASSAIKSGGFYTLDPTKNQSLNISTVNPSNTVCSPFKFFKTYDVSLLTNTLPKTPPGTVNIVYSTTKDCGVSNYTVEDVIPPNLDFNRVYFASDSVKSVLLKCPSWISIEEYCFQQYKFYLEEYKEVFELFGYSFPEFLVGSCTSNQYDFPSLEPSVRAFVHQIFSLVNFLQPNVKTKLLKLLKEDWKVIQWMNELYWTPISYRGDKYKHYEYNKLNPTIKFKLPTLSDSEIELNRVKICNITSDNGLFTTWVSSNEEQDKFFKELFSRYPLLQSVMLNLIYCRKKTPFVTPSLNHPIFDYLRHENSKHSN